jgi:hypothetical protein
MIARLTSTLGLVLLLAGCATTGGAPGATSAGTPLHGGQPIDVQL